MRQVLLATVLVVMFVAGSVADEDSRTTSSEVVLASMATHIPATDSTGAPKGTAAKSQGVPLYYKVAQNYPNPFNGYTRINLELPEATDLFVEILNSLGRRVKLLVDEPYHKGRHTIVWDGLTESGNSAASGVYFYRVITDGYYTTRKMIYLK